MRGSLLKRPITELCTQLSKNGLSIEKKNGCIFTDGKIEAGRYTFNGNISSQYITGLIMALPLLNGESIIYIKGKLESEPYVDMTVQIVSEYGIKIYSDKTKNGTIYYIPGNQEYIERKKLKKEYEGDWSAASMWLAMAYITKKFYNKDINIMGISPKSVQGDKRIANIFKSLECTLEKNFSSLKLSVDSSSEISITEDGTIEIDASDIPDAVPSIALFASAGYAQIRVINASRLRLKECNRLSGIYEIIHSVGGIISETDDGFLISGSKGKLLSGCNKTLKTYGDHRMVMLAVFMSIITEIPLIVEGENSVKKSYPNFINDIKNLGGEIWQMPSETE